MVKVSWFPEVGSLTVTGTSTDCSVPSIFMVRVCLTAASVVLGFAVTVTVVPFTVADKIPDNPETVNDLPSAFASVTFTSWFPPLSVKVIVLGSTLVIVGSFDTKPFKSSRLRGINWAFSLKTVTIPVMEPVPAL